MKGGIIIVAVIIAQVYSEKDFFASVAQLEDIFHNEGRVISELDNLLYHFEKHIYELKQKVTEVKLRRENITDVANYMQNPISAFLYLRSLTQFLTYMSMTVTEPMFKLLRLFEEIDKEVGWPTSDDLEGAANAIMRLQTTYNLDIEQLIQGRIFKKYMSSSLNALDCFIIGKVALTKDDVKLANEWLKRAYDMCINDEDCDPKLEIDLTEHYAYNIFLQGNFSRTLELTELLLKLQPKHERAFTNKQYLLDEINNLPSSQRSGEFMKNPDGLYDSLKSYYYSCQGSKIQSKEIASQLKCQYVHHNNPYLKIGPVKQEEAYLSPRIVVYKDLMYDSEIKELQTLAKQYLERSQTQGGVSEEIRVSKVTWLNNKDKNNSATKICNRFAAYSDLSLDSAEFLQVVNYGLGGHYLAHYDAFDEESSYEAWGSEGNRIATFLLYMNDVDEGGSTIFPQLGVSVKPEKGSAVVWRNLHRNGSLDERTLHAACPVLVGTKWAANLWFHEAGHEFTQPCPLKSYEV